MALQEFFPPRPAATPTIYAFASTHPDHAGLLKVGDTERIAADRIAEQFPSGVNPYRNELIESAMRSDGSGFTDHDVHRRGTGAIQTCSKIKEHGWGTGAIQTCSKIKEHGSFLVISKQICVAHLMRAATRNSELWTARSC